MRPGLFRFLICIFVTSILIAIPAQAQQPASQTQDPGTAPTPAPPNPSKTPPHAFWDRTNILLFSGVAVFRGLDYASTRNFMARGRDEILILTTWSTTCRICQSGSGRNRGLRRSLVLAAPHQPPQTRTLDIDWPHHRHRIRRGTQLLAEIEALITWDIRVRHKARITKLGGVAETVLYCAQALPGS